MSVINSYDLSNEKLVAFQQFEDLRMKSPFLISTLPIGKAPQNTKYTWGERQLSEASTTLATGISATSTTTVVLAASIGIELYDLLVFENTTGAEYKEVMQVTNISSAPTYTVTRGYGGSAALAAIAVDSKVYVIKPQKQGLKSSELTSGSLTYPTEVYNYVQRAYKTFSIATTALKTNIDYLKDLAADSLMQATQSVLWQMNRAFISGWKKANANDTTSKGSAGGLVEFLNGGNEVAVGGALTIDAINDGLEYMFADGQAPSNNLMLAMNANQARKLAALNTSGTNPVVQITQSTDIVGTAAVTRFLGDLPGNIAQVKVDANLPKDIMYILDMDLITVNYLDPFQVQEITQKGDHARTFEAYAEFTYMIKNGAYSHAKLSGLTI